MDEIDEAIANFEKLEAEKAAKKNQKKRARDQQNVINGVQGLVTTAEAVPTDEKPPPAKKSKPNKKAQQKAQATLLSKIAPPSIQLTLHNLKDNSNTIGMKDIRSLITSTLSTGVTVTWALIRSQSMIKHVVVVVLDSLTHELYTEASKAQMMPYLTSNFQNTHTKAPGNSGRVYDGISVLLRHPISKSRQKKIDMVEKQELESLDHIDCPKEGVYEEKMEIEPEPIILKLNDPALPTTQDIQALKALETHNGDSSINGKNNIQSQKMDESQDTSTNTNHQITSFDALNKPAMYQVDMKNRLEYSIERAKVSILKEKLALTPTECLLSPNDLQNNLYPLPHTITELGFVEIPKYRPHKQTAVLEEEKKQSVLSENLIEKEESPKSPPEYHILAIDCEMCRTTKGMELTRVVVVNVQLKVVYDSYVKPLNPILDYLTRWSGITAADLEDVDIQLKLVQQDILQIITPQTILVGHSLENDLKALKISHHRIVDTALLYPHSRGENYKNSLKFLAENWLREEIQVDTHNPIQDAVSAFKLALLKFKKGTNFGNLARADGEENLCEHFSAQGKRTIIIDNAHMCKIYAGSHTDCHGEEGDLFVAQRARKAFASCRYEFSYARLRSLEKYYASLEAHNADESSTNNNTEKIGTNQSTTNSSNQTNSSNPSTTDNISSTNGSTQGLVLKPLSVPDKAVELGICKDLDQRLSEMLKDCPKRTLVIATGAHGNLSRVRAINSRKRKLGESWSEEDDVEATRVFDEGRQTISFFTVIPDPSP